MEALEPRRAAERAPAGPAAVEPLGLVADPDLAQLDAAVKPRRQVLHQLAKVDALLGGEEERDAVPREPDLHLGQIHLELAQLDALPAVLERLLFLLPVVVVLIEVFLGGLANDLARHVAGLLELDEHAL